MLTSCSGATLWQRNRTCLPCWHRLHCLRIFFRTIVYTVRSLKSNLVPYSKATSLEGTFLSAWIGQGNAYAALEEGDQAMLAYRTAARLFPGYYSWPLFTSLTDFCNYYLMCSLSSASVALFYNASVYCVCY